MSTAERRIRVAMVTPAFPLDGRTVDGGVSGVSLYLCRALAQRADIDLTVIRPFAPVGFPSELTVDGIRCLTFTKPASHPRYYYIYHSVRSQVRKALEMLNPDVVHEQGHTIVERSRFPVVHTVHGIAERDVALSGSRLTAGLRQLIISQLSRRSRRSLANVIAISPYVRGFLGDPSHQHVREIWNPIDDRFFGVVRRPKRGVVFSASRMSSLKDVKTLIRAFAEVQPMEAGRELRLAGSGQDGQYGQECRRLAADLGVGDRVRFLGVLSVAQICAELERACVFALVSLQENAPLSIAEAMAAGVPVLATRVGGVPWMVADGSTGRLVEAGKLDSISKGLQAMLTNDDLTLMGGHGRRYAHEHFACKRVAALTADFYREILHEKSSTTSKNIEIKANLCEDV